MIVILNILHIIPIKLSVVLVNSKKTIEDDILTDCAKCKKPIKVWNEPAEKFTRLGADYLHSTCYLNFTSNYSLVHFT